MKDNDDYIQNILSMATETIPESVFVNQYLPLLFHKDPGAFNLRWLNEVARNPHVRVYVTDAKGEILYSVPPLRESPLSSANESVIKALNWIQLESNMHAAKGAALLEANLPNLINVDTGTSEDFVKQWKEILARYNYNIDAGTSAESEREVPDNFLNDTDDDW